MSQIKNKILELRQNLTKWNKEYYLNNAPSVDDAVFDNTMNELISLEKKYPEFYDPNSPTQKIGGFVSSTFKKVNHGVKMLSLKNAFDEKDLKHFDKTVHDIVPLAEYVVEPKIDGLSISIIYEDGKFSKAVSRGNGEIGEDVTENVRRIKSLPKEISIKNKIDFRGEIYLPKQKFDKLNNKRQKEGKPLFSNPRNAASGTIRQLDSSKVSERELTLFVYQAINLETLKDQWSSQWETIEGLKKERVPVNNLTKRVYSIDEAIKIINNLIDKRETLNYEIDGVVLKVNDNKHHASIGYTSKFPKWAIAFKLPTEVKETILKKIFPTVGRTGRITYNASLEPVQIMGTTVQKATLHNADYIKSLDLREGDKVQIKKAGDIIPKVIGTLPDNNHSVRRKWKEPKNCPTCLAQLERQPGEVDQYCINEECPSRITESIIHFVSRDGMNIEGLSEKQIIKFIELKLIKTIADIYKLTKEDLINLEGYQDKSVSNLLYSIKKSKKNPLNQLLFALGIRHIGKKTALDLAQSYGDINSLMNASLEELESKNDLGIVKASSIVKYFSNQKNINLIKELLFHGLEMNFEKIKVDTSHKLFGKTVVVTGTIEGASRNDVKKILATYGAKVTTQISSKTDFVISGDNPSESKISKIEKSKIIDIKEISKLNEI